MPPQPLSPLQKGKPRWRIRQSRFSLVWTLWNFPLVGYILYGASFPNSWLLGAAIFGGYTLIIVLYFGWLSQYAIRPWQLKSILLKLEGVPCPNCLYPLCTLQDAQSEHQCSECGCLIQGIEALRAWNHEPHLKVPDEWNEHL